MENYCKKLYIGEEIGSGEARVFYIQNLNRMKNIAISIWWQVARTNF